MRPRSQTLHRRALREIERALLEELLVGLFLAQPGDCERVELRLQLSRNVQQRFPEGELLVDPMIQALCDRADLTISRVRLGQLIASGTIHSPALLPR